VVVSTRGVCQALLLLQQQSSEVGDLLFVQVFVGSTLWTRMTYAIVGSVEWQSEEVRPLETEFDSAVH
jgi:hypothetical protein